MKLAPQTFAGSVLITALVAGGVWYAHDPEGQEWSLPCIGIGNMGGNVPKFVSVNRFEWSADGQQLLVLFSGDDGAEGRVALHDLGKSDTVMPIDVAGESASAASLSPDGRQILLGTHQGRLWWIESTSLESATPLLDLPQRTFVTSAAITGDGQLIGAGTSSGSIYLGNPTNLSFTILTTHWSSAVQGLRFSRDGLHLAVTQANGRISVWESATGDLLQEFLGHNGPVRAAEFLPDGNRLISAGFDDTVRIWDIATGRELWRGEVGLFGVTTLAVSPDGRTAAWGGYNRKIIVWDLDRLTKKFEVATPSACILHLQFSPDGTALGAAGQEEVIRLYDVLTAAEKTGIEVVTPAHL